MFLSNAYAQSASGAATGPGTIEQLIPFIAIFAIFYFLILRPQSKRQKAHQNFVAEMKRGDTVITSGGIYGRVEGITEKFVTLEISDGVNIRILKSQIASTFNEGATNA
ncbi:MAG: preprotein translocase subunit YajC [Bdellovibrionales bacterium RBG_16_40_8]|nr:MAG: preprotein translocase subunit YajC [Bdellovibrionales bacterium RBG_16_40_8]